MKIKNGILGNRQFGYLETSSVSKFHEVERVSRNYTFLRRAVDICKRQKEFLNVIQLTILII